MFFSLFFWQVITVAECGERWGACSWNLLEKCKTSITPSWIPAKHETAAALYDYLPPISNVEYRHCSVITLIHGACNFFVKFHTHKHTHSVTNVAPSLVQKAFTGSERGGENKHPVFLLTLLLLPGKQLMMTAQQLSYHRLPFVDFFFLLFPAILWCLRFQTAWWASWGRREGGELN